MEHAKAVYVEKAARGAIRRTQKRLVPFSLDLYGIIMLLCIYEEKACKLCGDGGMTQHFNKPALLSMVICDQVIREQGTKKPSLIGLFANINSTTFPCIHPQLYVYITVVGGRGKQVGKLRFVRDDPSTPIMQAQGDVQFPNPVATVDMEFCLKKLRFEKAGLFHFEFWLDDDIIGQRSLSVTKVSQGR